MLRCRDRPGVPPMDHLIAAVPEDHDATIRPLASLPPNARVHRLRLPGADCYFPAARASERGAR